MTGFVARVTRPVTLVDQELLTHPEYLISLPVLIGDCVSQVLVFLVFLCVRVTKSKVFFVVFLDYY